MWTTGRENAVVKKLKLHLLSSLIRQSNAPLPVACLTSNIFGAWRACRPLRSSVIGALYRYNESRAVRSDCEPKRGLTVTINSDNAGSPLRRGGRSSYSQIMAASFILVAGSCLSQIASGDDWLTGARLEKVLAEADPLSLSEQPLRDSLDSLQEVYQVCIFLDRRVDPNQRVTLTTGALPLRDRLTQIAEPLDLGSAVLEWGVYIGPLDTATSLATLTALQQQQIRGGERVVARRLLADRPLNWPHLTQPRQIIDQLAKTYGVEVEGLEEMPFDLWAEKSLPEMDFAAALTLLLAGFNSHFEWRDGGQVARVIPLPKDVAIQESYRLPTGREPPLEQWKDGFAGATFVIKGREVQVDGPLEAHKAVRDWVNGRSGRPAARPGGDRVLTLTIASATLQQASDYLAKQLELEFVFTPAAQELLSERIAIEVKEASLDELLHELLDPLGLEFELKDKQVNVSLKP